MAETGLGWTVWIRHVALERDQKAVRGRDNRALWPHVRAPPFHVNDRAVVVVGEVVRHRLALELQCRLPGGRNQVKRAELVMPVVNLASDRRGDHRPLL